MDKTKLVRKFDKQSSIYERQRKKGNLGAWRRQLLQQADGKVLELAVGAGANFAYYSSDVQVTGVDFSPQMLKKAKHAAEEHEICTEFLMSDIETLEFPENTFDTVVSTLSFCGYEQPVQIFNQLSRWCKPQGKVLLLEHGISHHPVIAFAQKTIDPIHHKLIGCHQKRDILRLIQESNIQIQEIKGHWQGMFHLIWAKPGS